MPQHGGHGLAQDRCQRRCLLDVVAVGVVLRLPPSIPAPASRHIKLLSLSRPSLSLIHIIKSNLVPRRSGSPSRRRPPIESRPRRCLSPTAPRTGSARITNALADESTAHLPSDVTLPTFPSSGNGLYDRLRHRIGPRAWLRIPQQPPVRLVLCRRPGKNGKGTRQARYRRSYVSTLLTEGSRNQRRRTFPHRESTRSVHLLTLRTAGRNCASVNLCLSHSSSATQDNHRRRPQSCGKLGDGTRRGATPMVSGGVLRPTWPDRPVPTVLLPDRAVEKVQW